MMDQNEYAEWWIDNGDRDDLPEPVATLAAHVSALQDRIDKLTPPDDHDQQHPDGCRCYTAQCACAYDHPADVCMIHHPEAKDHG